MDLRIFEAKALALALTESGHAVSERTVQRWKKGVTRPKPQDIRAIQLLVGAAPDTTKDAAPSEEGAAATLLDLWKNGEGPKWAHDLTKTITDEIQRLRDESVERMILDAVRGAGAELRGRLLDELTREDAGPTR